jgi:hypothetical protein
MKHADEAGDKHERGGDGSVAYAFNSELPFYGISQGTEN